MYIRFMSDTNQKFVRDAIESLKVEVGAPVQDGSFWVVYGSFVLNTQKSGSDMDMLYVHELVDSKPTRIQAYFRGFPVTIYSISKADLAADGDRRLYGGYFAGKLLNPHAFFGASDADQTLTQRVAGGFIGPFAASAAQGRTTSSAENLLADTVLARLRLCPWYDSYFLRYYMAPDFEAIWHHMQCVIADSLLSSGQVIRLANGGFKYRLDLDDDQLHQQLIQVTARFWALGSCLHSNRFDFPDYYIVEAIYGRHGAEVEPRVNAHFSKGEPRVGGET